jgi:hypothetical protein
MSKSLIRFVATALIALLGITTAFAGGGTRFFVGESIPVIDKAIVRPAPQPKNKPHEKPPQGSVSKPDPKPGPKPRPKPRIEAASVVYYTTGFEVTSGQPQQPVQDIQPQAEQTVQNIPSTKQKQEIPHQLQEPVVQQVEQPVKQLPQPVQETQNEPIIIMPQSVNAGNDSRSKRRSQWTYDIPGMTGGNGNGPLIYNP